MGRRSVLLLILLAAGAPAPASARPDASNVTAYSKMCNASAAVDVGNGLFVVADDEDKDPTPLRLYRAGQGGDPLSEPSIPDAILDLDPAENLEVDIEGATRIGDLVYWIGSHSASKDGKKRPNRRRLFATRLRVSGEKLTIDPAGKPYKTLLHDLHADPRYAPFDLKTAATKAPKDDGALSIEGLASTPDDALLIGFRNPIIDGKALLARLKNPSEVLAEKSPDFGKPILLDLGSLGIRSIERHGSEYIIVAGPPGEGPPFKLYRWSGDPDTPPQAIPGVDLGDLHPEALFFDASGAYLLSDDGKLPIAGTPCEDLSRPHRRFRGLRLSPSP